MRIIRLECFKRDYKKLPSHIWEKLDKQLKILIRDTGHPSLGVRKIEGHPGCWEARVSRAYRFTFSWVKDAVALRRVGTHDVLKNP